MPNKMIERVGIVGGGQLARMLGEAGSAMGTVEIASIDPSSLPPARTSTRAISGASLSSPADLHKLLSQSDIVTFEIEHVDVDALEKCYSDLVASGLRPQLRPSLNTIRNIQDKFRQKLMLKEHKLPVADFENVISKDDLSTVGMRLGYPFMLKSKRMAYDGKGNSVIRSPSDFDTAWISLCGCENESGNIYAERWVDFECELAVMVARDINGQLKCFPVVQTFQKNSICHLVIAPAPLPSPILNQTTNMALDAVSCFDGAGIFGVELFLLKSGELILNEIAPRPHNSGHYSIEACYVSQFEQHLRAITGKPLGNSEMKVSSAFMVNIIGEENGEASMAKCEEMFNRFLRISGASVHWYGKTECKKGRKMGHFTIVGNSHNEVLSKIALAYPEMELPLVKGISQVAVIMGSDSDLPIMRAAVDILKEFEITTEVTIVSAHRTPDRLVEFARSAESRGLKVIIAGAGGAAHLPGMVASMTPLPVIGVPVSLKKLDGMDSLLSIVQMPGGVPVATVAIDNAVNAGLLAARMLGIHDGFLREKMKRYQEKLRDTVLEKVEKLKTDSTI